MMLETLSQHVNAPIGIGTTTYTETRSSRTKTETSPTMEELALIPGLETES